MNCKVALDIYDIPKEVYNHMLEPFTWHGVDFFPKDEFSYRANKDSLRKLNLGNLDLRMFGGQAASLKISNSIHKAWTNGINYNDFTRQNLSESIELISDTLNIDFPNAKLSGRFETAVNIRVQDVQKCYLSQLKFGHHSPLPMIHKNKRYGTKFITASYSLKGYSPFQKHHINKEYVPINIVDIFRFESVDQISYLRQKELNLNYVSDLLCTNTLQSLGANLFKTAKKVRLMPKLSDDLEYDDLEIYYFFINATTEQLKRFIKKNRSTYYRHKKRFDTIMQQHKQEDIDIRPLIKEKWNDLMTN